MSEELAYFFQLVISGLSIGSIYGLINKWVVE
jgi:branched-subunit amino acid ABC-type transport system permease component